MTGPGGALRVSGVDFVAGRAILAGVDAEFPAGTMTALSGPSGSGKTTLLSIAGGLVEPTAGTASYAGEPMWRGTGDPRPEVAFVLQVYGLVPILSAAENVSIALRARGVDPEDADERALVALSRFGIGDLGDRQVEELSGGQMQRVALARGLAVGAPVLLADEPTSELDEVNRALVLSELRAEAARGAVVVVATHDPAVVDACDRHLTIDEGRLTDHVAPVQPPSRREVTQPEVTSRRLDGFGRELHADSAERGTVASGPAERGTVASGPAEGGTVASGPEVGGTTDDAPFRRPAP